jgi:glucose-1-phosphate thymidylyltransferase
MNFNRKGILLAGGYGSRLYPATRNISKQLLPIYDKPMVYYPLSSLMMAGIRDILLITTPHEQHLFQQLLGDGSQWGIQLSYATQSEPKGIAEAFLIGEDFLAGDPVCLMLGDNILYGEGIASALQQASSNSLCHIFGYYVHDPERYGVIEFDANDHPCNIIEKPCVPPSHYAAIGVYFYNNDVIDIAKQLKPSARGELEITDISCEYLRRNLLRVTKLGRGVAWLDTGTPSALLEAANFIQILEKRQGLKICCPEEIAWRMEFIDTAQFVRLAEELGKSEYGRYLTSLAEAPSLS